MLKVKGFSRPEAGGRWTDSAHGEHRAEVVTRIKGNWLHPATYHSVRDFDEGADTATALWHSRGAGRGLSARGGFARQTVDLSLGDVRADGLARIQIAVDHTFVPAGARPWSGFARAWRHDPKDRTSDRCGGGPLYPSRPAPSISLASPDAERMIRLAGFSGPDPDGRWTDGTVATIDLKFAPGSTEMSRLRLHVMPFVTKEKGQTLQLRCGEGPDKVVEFSPGTLAWRIVRSAAGGRSSRRTCADPTRNRPYVCALEAGDKPGSPRAWRHDPANRDSV